MHARRSSFTLLSLVTGLAAPALAAAADADATAPSPALRVAATLIVADDGRGVDEGKGIELGFGRAWSRRWSWEAAFATAVLETGVAAGTDFYQTALGVDFTRRFGGAGRFEPFVLAGAGFVDDDVLPDVDDGISPFWRVGAGFTTAPLGGAGIRLRVEARAVRDELRSGVTDWHVQLGAVVPLGRATEPVIVERVVYREAAPPPARIVYVEAPDTDGDGVVDRVDACPNTLQGAAVDGAGCIDAEQSVRLDGVSFELGSARLTESAERILERAFLALRDQPAVRVEIAGHTDSTGSDAANLALSAARAEAVRVFLVGKGVDPERLSARGYGESRPLKSETTDADRALNRRVELRVQERRR